MKDETNKDTPTEEQEAPEEATEETPAEEQPSNDTHAEEEVPDTAAQLEQLRQENAQLREQISRGRLEAEIMAQAPNLGVDPKSVPYLIRLADLTGAVDDKGTVNKDAVTTALKKVLEDVPGLKKTEETSGGFLPLGGAGRRQNTPTTGKQVPVKRWNRFH